MKTTTYLILWLAVSVGINVGQCIHEVLRRREAAKYELIDTEQASVNIVQHLANSPNLVKWRERHLAANEELFAEDNVPLLQSICNVAFEATPAPVVETQAKRWWR